MYLKIILDSLPSHQTVVECLPLVIGRYGPTVFLTLAIHIADLYNVTYVLYLRRVYRTQYYDRGVSGTLQIRRIRGSSGDKTHTHARAGVRVVYAVNIYIIYI